MKTSRWVLGIMMLTAVVMLNACDDDDDKRSVNASDRDFVTNASRANLTEIEFGKVAVTRGSSEMVKDFGQHMVTEHTTALNDLKSVARDYRNTDIAEDMDQQHKQMLDQLRNMTGHAFDSAYIAAQVMDHQTAKTLFESGANSATETRIKTYAQKYLPHIEMHLEKADSIHTVLNTPGMEGN